MAEQTNGEGETGLSPPITFTIDTVAPSPTLQSPGGLIADSAPLLKGTAGIEPGDLPAISVVLHHGDSLAGSPAGEATVEAHGGEWSAKLGALPDGIYTAQVSQSDEAGNVGVSEAVTFTIDTTAPVPAISSPSYGSADGGRGPSSQARRASLRAIFRLSQWTSRPLGRAARKNSLRRSAL